MIVGVFFDGQTADGESLVIKRSGQEQFENSEFLLKVTGDLGGGTIKLHYDFGDDDFAPLLDADGVTEKEITAVGVLSILCKAGCGMKAVLSGSTGANVTVKRV